MKALKYVLPLLGVLLVSCGGADDQDKSAELVRQFLAGDPAVCSSLAGDVAASVGNNERRCRGALKVFRAEKAAVTITGVTVTNNRAAVVAKRGEDKARVGLVKRGGSWKISTVGITAEQQQVADKEAEANRPAFQEAQDPEAAVAAFYEAIRQEDPKAFCGVISEAEARQVGGEKRSQHPFRDCVEALGGFDWATDKKAASDVTVRRFTVAGGRGTVTLNDGRKIKVEEAGGRWVISDVKD